MFENESKSKTAPNVRPPRVELRSLIDKRTSMICYRSLVLRILRRKESQRLSRPEDKSRCSSQHNKKIAEKSINSLVTWDVTRHNREKHPSDGPCRSKPAKEKALGASPNNCLTKTHDGLDHKWHDMRRCDSRYLRLEKSPITAVCPIG